MQNFHFFMFQNQKSRWTEQWETANCPFVQHFIPQNKLECLHILIHSLNMPFKMYSLNKVLLIHVALMLFELFMETFKCHLEKSIHPNHFLRACCFCEPFVLRAFLKPKKFGKLNIYVFRVFHGQIQLICLVYYVEKVNMTQITFKRLFVSMHWLDMLI